MADKDHDKSADKDANRIPATPPPTVADPTPPAAHPMAQGILHPGVTTTHAPALADDERPSRTKEKCPQCDRPLRVYEGSNPHKGGTLECDRCQRRYRVGVDL